MMIYAVRTGFEPVEANKAPQLFSRESLSTTQAPDQELLYWDGMCNYTTSHHNREGPTGVKSTEAPSNG